MRRYYAFVLVVLIACGSVRQRGGANGQAEATAAASTLRAQTTFADPAPPPATSSFHTPTATETTLANGVRLSIAELPGSMAAIRLTMEAGELDAATPEIAHAAAQTVALGTAFSTDVEVHGTHVAWRVQVPLTKTQTVLAELGKAMGQRLNPVRFSTLGLDQVSESKGIWAIAGRRAFALEAPSLTSTHPARVSSTSVDSFMRSHFVAGKLHVAVATPGLVAEALEWATTSFGRLPKGVATAGQTARSFKAGRFASAEQLAPSSLRRLNLHRQPSTVVAIIMPGAASVEQLAARMVAHQWRTIASNREARSSYSSFGDLDFSLTLQNVSPDERISSVKTFLSPVANESGFVAASRRTRFVFAQDCAHLATLTDWLAAARTSTRPYTLQGLAKALSEVGLQAAQAALSELSQGSVSIVVDRQVSDAERSAWSIGSRP